MYEHAKTPAPCQSMRLGWRIYATKICVVGVRTRDAALTARSIVAAISSFITRHRTEYLCTVLNKGSAEFVVVLGGDFDRLPIREVRLIREVRGCACASVYTEEQRDDNIR